MTTHTSKDSRKRIRLIDSTLRDGSHAVAHQFTSETIRKVASALDETGISTIEVSHGDGLGGSSFNYGFSAEPEENWLQAASESLKNARLAVLLLPGIGTQDHLKMARDLGATVARIATHCTEADIAEQHIGLAKEMGMEVIGFLMLAHMIPPAQLAQQARLMESYGADCVYVTDSAGALTPGQYRERIRALRESIGVAVGVHAHNNLGMSVANSLAAVEEGATYADGCCGGLGAGAGNAPLEVLAAVFELEGYETGVDLFRLMDVTDQIVRPLMPRPQIIDGVGLTLGYAGVYSSFLLHAQRAAERFGLDPRDILVELGRRKVVGGQEDTIIEVAAELSKARGPASAQA
ncbi:MAG TPA: 4-hydroxy-2-oxovalerate aldolase [Dehalococcoidia bacterium]|nr:4-hydroxy-2-oxovalerate aldolase [Dehalococcoidia bacterium]